jgi:hypothetical protein
MTRITGLAPVSHTLEKLNLCDQNLTKIEGLTLPHLRELLLHENKITKIENLQGCPRLQKLWLFNNQITKIENLHCVGDLRELWLQHNKITQVAGLESLVNLQVLALSANRVADFRELQKLATLPALRDLSLDDAHFGRCETLTPTQHTNGTTTRRTFGSSPIALAEGYWAFCVRKLKQVRVTLPEHTTSGSRLRDGWGAAARGHATCYLLSYTVVRLDRCATWTGSWSRAVTGARRTKPTWPRSPASTTASTRPSGGTR